MAQTSRTPRVFRHIGARTRLAVRALAEQLPPEMPSVRLPRRSMSSEHPRTQADFRHGETPPWRSYAQLTLPPDSGLVPVSYRVIATRPHRAHTHRWRLGSAYDRIWKPPVAGTDAAVAVRTPFATYVRPRHPTAHLVTDYATDGEVIDPYRDFERAAVTHDGDLTITAVNWQSAFRAMPATTTRIRTVTEALIDLAHQDRAGWQATRPAYAALLEHLPHELATIVFPSGRTAYFPAEASFGQTLRLTEDEPWTVDLRTVIVYQSDVSSVQSHVDDLLDQERLHQFPINDPEVTIHDTVAIIEDSADVMRVLRL